jgi:hypothetical protein
MIRLNRMKKITISRCLGNIQQHCTPTTDRRNGTRQLDISRIKRIKRPCARDEVIFESWVEHRQFQLKVIGGLLSTSKKITQHHILISSLSFDTAAR